MGLRLCSCFGVFVELFVVAEFCCFLYSNFIVFFDDLVSEDLALVQFLFDLGIVGLFGFGEN